MKNSLKLLITILFVISYASGLFSQSIQQQLIVITNDGVVSGNFVIDIQVKGTSLTSANTLGSATIDVQFDNTKLSYQSADNFAFSFLDGYSVSATDNTTFIRFGATGGSVGPSQGTGYDIGSSYATWVRLHFQILSTASTSLTIDNGTNQIGLFTTHSNSDGSGSIVNQTLSAPINITDEPLPLELKSLNAKVSGSNVELLWRTSTEVNNYGFEVERKSIDNESAIWEKVGFVNGSGNSNSLKDYTFTDKNITGGTKFSYRLKQIDNNGTFTYSTNVDVKVIPNKFELFQNYPNPFNPSTTIEFSLPKDSRIVINIYNILGEKVAQLLNADYKAGYYKVQLNSQDFNLASGIYFYTIQSKNFKAVKKMVLMK